MKQKNGEMIKTKSLPYYSVINFAGKCGKK